MVNELWVKFENHLLNQGVSRLRIDKLKVMYNTVSRRTPDLNKAMRKDIEALVTDLHRNKFRRKDNKPFSGSTKSDIKKFLKQFYKWLKGKNEVYPKEVNWIRSKIAKDELPQDKPILSISEVRELSSLWKKPHFRIMTLLLFDSGFRISELLSVKKRDITWEEFQYGQSCFWISCNASKTERRKIPVPLFTNDLEEFFNTEYHKKLPEDDLVFPVSYDSFRQPMVKKSKKLFNKKITPHSLRHSSATYYSKEYDGNMQMIAQRYGWTFSSTQMQTYIRRSGAYEKAGAKKVFTNEVMRLKEENNALREKMERISTTVEKWESKWNKAEA